MKYKVWLLVFVLLSLGAWYWHSQILFKIISSSNSQLSTSTPLIIKFLDVGQGDASLVEFPNGQKMLVDCAIDTRILSALGRTLPFTDRKIDYLVVSHPDSDHYGGCIDVLKHYNVKNIIYNGLEKPKDFYWQEFMQAVEASGASYQIINQINTWQTGSSTITWLYPNKFLAELPVTLTKTDNNTSIIFKIGYNNHSVLFTGDAENDLEQYLLNNFKANLKSDILKVGHHGSSGSSGVSFLEAVAPKWAIISVGKDNDYGHPSERVIKKLERVGAQVLRTDLQGDITCQVGEEVSCN